MRNLDDLLLVLEARPAVGAEVPELGLQAMAALAGEAELLAEDGAVMPSDRRGPRKKLRPFCCDGGERVVERAVRVRRQHDLRG